MTMSGNNQVNILDYYCGFQSDFAHLSVFAHHALHMLLSVIYNDPA